jgi:hypothetical protein
MYRVFGLLVLQIVHSLGQLPEGARPEAVLKLSDCALGVLAWRDRSLVENWFASARI